MNKSKKQKLLNKTISEVNKSIEELQENLNLKILCDMDTKNKFYNNILWIESISVLFTETGSEEINRVSRIRNEKGSC